MDEKKPSLNTKTSENRTKSSGNHIESSENHANPAENSIKSMGSDCEDVPILIHAPALTPTALTIAGSDSGGGAGIQADLKAFSANGVFGASVITALTAQNTCEVRGIYPVDTAFITQQIETVFDDMRIDSVKIGMLGTAEVITCVASALQKIRTDVATKKAPLSSPYGVMPSLVIDPVMVAKSGDTLLQSDAISALKKDLLPLATVITPNIPEAAALLETEESAIASAMEDTVKKLYDSVGTAVLLKGGHASTSGNAVGNVSEQNKSVDYFYDGRAVSVIEAPRFSAKNTHGTGCTLSATISANLAKNMALEDAIRTAKEYITQAIKHADTLRVGQGCGAVKHFYAYWT